MVQRANRRQPPSSVNQESAENGGEGLKSWVQRKAVELREANQVVRGSSWKVAPNVLQEDHAQLNIY